VRSAIITGAAGLVGSAVAQYLAKQGVEVLCLGRKTLTEAEVATEFGFGNVNYLKLPMESVHTLPRRIDEIGWSPGDSCVFYHFAWRGAEKLTDGNFREQFINAAYTANAVVAAQRAGCVKFVGAGTMEETFAESYLFSDQIAGPYESAQTDYTISKLAARDMSKMIAYLEKIDYIHTRLSVPLDQSLSRGGYVATTMRKILQGESCQPPSNPNLFDIISTKDVAEAYFRIGQQGINKSDYFVGTSKPKTLREYFQTCERIREGDFSAVADSEHASAAHEHFSIKRLVDDTGFTPSVSYEQLVESLVRA
jgi:nucleoside-diphosphate-sugar epimerase